MSCNMSNIIKAIFIWGFASFYGSLVALRLLLQIIRHPINAFKVKQRDTAPNCLNDPSLGAHGYLRTKELRIHYVANGDRSKPLMLLVHGFPEFWYSWRYQLKEFANDYRVVAIDTRGYGDSDKPSGIAQYTLDHLTGDIRDVIPALGYSSCVLVAHDWGAAIGWQFAMEYPDLVDKLIILNGPHPQRYSKHVASSFKQFLMSWYIFLFQLPLLPELMLRVFDYRGISSMFYSRRMGLRNKSNMTSDDIEAFKYNFQRQGASTAMINYYRALMRYTKKLKTAVITSPTLLIWGEEDKALDVCLTEGLDKYIHDITVKLVPNASHWVQQDQPEHVNNLMREFLQG